MYCWLYNLLFSKMYRWFLQNEHFLKSIQIRVFSGRYFLAFGLNTERYGVSLRIQSKFGKMRTRKNSVFGHFSPSDELFFWSVFFCIRTEYGEIRVSLRIQSECGKIRIRKNSVSGYFSRSVNTLGKPYNCAFSNKYP